jgi:putative PIN family toxin of toxin-antitoxin system
VPKPKIVIDTNVFLTALRSRKGASYRLLSLVSADLFDVALSVPLALEYEAVAKRESSLAAAAIDDILDRLCALAELHSIYFLWRPWLPDPKDDFILELAVQAGCTAIITYNKRDFRGAEKFGTAVLNPQEFLDWIGAMK